MDLRRSSYDYLFQTSTPTHRHEKSFISCPFYPSRIYATVQLTALPFFPLSVGGNSYDEAISCSGGSRSDACFSARLMWRSGSMGELYTYLPPSSDYPSNDNVCDIAPFSTCNAVYGASVGRGSFHFVGGGWTTISQRVRLNDVGETNGELELFVGGQSVINVGGLVLRDSDAGRIRGIMMQTFFGGGFLNHGVILYWVTDGFLCFCRFDVGVCVS